MQTIYKLDKNFNVETSIEREGLTFFDVEEDVFQIYGVFREGDIYRRMPEAIAKDISEGVHELSRNAAGGRVRFITDSPYVAIYTEMETWKMPHFALSGSAGYDMFVEKEGRQCFAGAFIPPFQFSGSYEAVKDFEDFDGSEQLVTINMPSYSTVKKLYIGVKQGSVLKKAPEYTHKKPVVFYGSSITQGACASNPGSTYQNILSRKFDFDYINLGFSGNAKGEPAMADYIKQLDMSLFVMDYDYNANSLADLRSTHDKMFCAIREAQPELPILILPRPKYDLNKWEQRRLAIIYDTYTKAKERGDEHVYFIDNKKLMHWAKDIGTVDGVHPTDSGFLSMANAMEEVFEMFF